jgi:Fe-S cluster biosynthesis and repair protein YggX
MSETRLVQCRKLGKELPGLDRPPYRNELGQRIFNEVSKEAWEMWKKDSIKIINTYGSSLDLSTAKGQQLMFDQCAIYFGFQEGEVAKTAWTPPSNDK